MIELLRGWYGVLGQLSAPLGESLGRWAGAGQMPIVSALLFGLIGASAPCQLTTNLSAIAYVSRRAGEGRPWVEALAYTLGKALVYTVIGAAAIGLGLRLQEAAVPVVVVARRVLGPLLIVLGLVFLGLVRLRLSVGGRLAAAIQRRAAPGRVRGAFLMGAAFAFAFCPTLFLLFFGLTIPLGLTSGAGLLIPAVFALGTAVPLLAWTALLATGRGLVEVDPPRLTRLHAAASRVAGVVFLLAGLNDTLVYWAL
ncbi:MAG: sulfite exporter TauE/SafE family protein [Candidatus Rokubacteria bacterium]|nr:sulfite exporter TauE/SafE family protein [Candidatus Rokubacteria bacterium]